MYVASVMFFLAVLVIRSSQSQHFIFMYNVFYYNDIKLIWMEEEITARGKCEWYSTNMQRDKMELV